MRAPVLLLHVERVFCIIKKWPSDCWKMVSFLLQERVDINCILLNVGLSCFVTSTHSFYLFFFFLPDLSVFLDNLYELFIGTLIFYFSYLWQIFSQFIIFYFFLFPLKWMCYMCVNSSTEFMYRKFRSFPKIR